MYIDKSRKKAKKKPMLYSIEIKRKKRWDKKYVPSVEMYVDLVIKELRSLRITKRTSLLCFDLEILESIHRKAPEIIIRLGVKGITTDYPDTLIELVQTMRRS